MTRRAHDGGLGALTRSLLRRAAHGRPEVQSLMGELDGPLGMIERTVVDLALGEGSPRGFDPRRHLAPGLPRLRPLLVMLAARAAGSGEDDTDVASAGELLHLAVAVHDAALGRQGGRRRRVARRLLGGAASWLGGHHLALRALEMARAAPAPEILGELLDALREVAEAHALAEELRDRDPTEADYREWAAGHSGAVLAFCTRAGGHLAGAPRNVVGALGRYGRHVGVAWAGAEDRWAMSLPPQELLRWLAECTASGQPSLPLIRLLATDESADALLDLVLEEGDLDAAADLGERMRAAGGSRVSRLVGEEAIAARRALSALPRSAARDALDRIAAGLVLGADRGPPSAPIQSGTVQSDTG